MKVPKPIETHYQYSVDEFAHLLKERIDFINDNFYQGLNDKPKHCSIDDEVRIIAEINILSAHFTAALLLTSI